MNETTASIAPRSPIPSGKLTVRYGPSPFLIGKSTMNVRFSIGKSSISQHVQ